MFKQKETKNETVNFVDEKGNPINQNKEVNIPEPKNLDDIDLKASFTYDDDNLRKVEAARIEFARIIKKENKIKWIVTIASMGLLLFAFLFLIQMHRGQQNYEIPGYCLTGFSVIIIVSYYVIVRKYNVKKMDIYLKSYYGGINAYIFSQSVFSEVNGNIDGNIANAEFNDSTLYQNISSFKSRNVINFRVHQKYDCKMCDCAAQVSTTQRLEPAFIGKYIIAPNTYQEAEPVIVYLTGNSRALPPNNVEKLPKVVNTKRMIIYSNNKNYESILNAKAREIIANIITNNVLVDVSIAITKGVTYIGLGYDDCLMVVPLNEKFNPRPTEKFKKDMVLIADLIATLNH